MIYLPSYSVDHVAIVVRSLSEYPCNNIEVIKDQGVKVGFLGSMEIVEPLDNSSSVFRFLEKNGSGAIHHVGLTVSDIEAAIKDLETKGIQMIDSKPRIGARGKRIAFIHPRSTGGTLFELCESIK